LDELRIEKEKLATYGVTIEDKDYRSTLITSLPNFLSNFASSLLANARLHAATGTVDPDQLISLISEEYNRSVSQHMRHSAKSSLKSNDKDEAMLASSNGKGKVLMDVDRTQTFKPIAQTCYHCGQTGHISKECDLRHDVHHMTLEEEDKFIQHILANHDATMAAVAGLTTHMAMSEGTLVEREVNELDFVRSNR
jgi:hypothetical protein